MPLDKPFELIGEADLLTLISSGVRDARISEFHRELPRSTDAGKKDFLNDIASFANTLGGYVIYGMAGRDGAAIELPGLEKDAAEAALHWMEQAATAGIAPRVTGLRFKIIPLSNGLSAILVRVPKTWAGPHMVVFHHSNKFYSRNSTGKYLLQVDELRAAFALGDALGEKMRAFRLDRVNAIMNRGLTVSMSDTPKTVLHILPLASFRPGFRIDLEKVAEGDGQLIRPMEARSLVSHYNYDGLITFSSMEKFAYSYLQVFRNGCIEATECLLLEPKDGRKFFPSVAFEREVIQCGERILGMLRQLHVDPPFVVMLSYLGVRGYSMFVGSMRWQSNAHHIERDNLFLDEIIISDAEADFGQAMRPAFDQVWNSCGWAKSLNYDVAGNWVEQAR